MSLEKSASILKTTIEKLRNLEAEKKSLLLEIDELKKMADAKTNALECEVKTLMEEVKALRVLMYGEEPSELEIEEPKATEMKNEPENLKDHGRYKGSFLSLSKNPK